MEKGLSLKISKRSLALFLLILPHLKPDAFDYAYPIMGDVFNFGRIISVAFMILIVIKKKYKPSSIIYVISMWQLWVLITTILNDGETHRAFMVLLSTIALTVIVDFYSNEPNILVDTLFVNFAWLIVANFLTILIFPEGVYTRGVHNENICYFLGFKNAMFCYLMCTLILAFIKISSSRRTFWTFIIVGITCVTCLLVWSASTIVAVGVFLALIFLCAMLKGRGIFKVLTFNKVFVGYIAIDVLLCGVGILTNAGIINWFVTQVLQKDLTLNGRTSLWAIANLMILEKPFIGYGIGEHIVWHGYSWYGHNEIYNALLEGGIVGLLFYIIVVMLVAKRFMRANCNKVYHILLCAYVGIFVLFLVEAGTNPVFYIFYVLGYNIDRIAKYKLKSDAHYNLKMQKG